MSQPRLRKRLAVEACGLDVAILRAVVGCADREGLAFTEMDDGLLEQRAADEVAWRAWTKRIKAGRVEHIPCRHLAGVFVADHPDLIVEFVHHPADGVLR